MSSIEWSNRLGGILVLVGGQRLGCGGCRVLWRELEKLQPEAKG
ncbi:MAG TPA: hypothetical protein VNK46_16370 [Nitrospiraceae bacterium]|nr:hypothetical protein [Nitrospiraceae bacterium]